MRCFYLTLFLVMAGGLSSGWSQGKTVHVLNPWADDPQRADLELYIRGADQMGFYPGEVMTNEGGDWWSYTFATANPPNEGFGFIIVSATPPNFQDAQFFAPEAGISVTDLGPGGWFDQWQLGQDYPDATDIYIFWQDSSQVVVTDIAPSSKAIFILNPWTVSAPTISLNGGEYEGMRLSDHCEWFVYYVNGDSTYNVHFREIFGGAEYGAAGGADATPLDLNAHFAAYDSAYIYPNSAPDGAPVISPTFPGFEGICGFNLAATVRDFCIGDGGDPTADCPNPHIDFETGVKGGTLQENMVGIDLGPDKKPVIGPNPYYQSAFDQWFNTVPDVNAETCVDIPMTKTQSGLWEYDSYNEPSKGFFPIDEFAEIGADERYPSTYKVRNGGGFYQNDPTGEEHNFHFCLEMHASFVYKPGMTPEKGQTFIFEGDDDVWVFIDDQLMLDLGGIHEAITATLIMDDIAPSFGWSAGDTLPFDFFLCERQTTSSNMWIRSSIYFEQGINSWIDTVAIDANTVRYDVWRRVGADGSCASGGSGVDTVPEMSDFLLTGTGIDGQQDLSTTPVSGIQIGGGSTDITIDTMAIRTNNALSPGSYVLTVRTKNKPQREFRIPFTVYGELGVRFTEPKMPVDTLAGEIVPVYVNAVSGGTFIAVNRNYSLQIPPGLQVYLDPNGITPAGATISTDATGRDTLWVTGDPSAPSDQTYTLSLLNQNGLQSDTYPNLTFRTSDLDVISPTLDNLLSFIGLSRSNGLRFRLENPAVLGFEIYGINGKLLWEHPRTALKEGTHLLPLSPSTAGENLRFLRVKSEGKTSVRMLAPVGP